MKREFPFSLAVLTALVIHLLFAVVLKRHTFLVAANPAPAPRAPMTVRFVEVPPEAKPVEKPPPTRNFSENHYKAGSQTPVKGVQGRPGTPPGPTGVQPGRDRTVDTSVSRPSSSRVAPVLRPSPENKSEGISSGSSNPTDSKMLSKSLQDLNQFIQPHSGGAGGEGGVPTEDPGSGVFFDTQGFDLGPWAGRVVAIVKRNWMIPVTAELGLKGIVGISFQVDKNGRILNPKIISSSTIPSYDQAALNALISSSPLPPLPADFPRPALPAVFRFYYNVPVPN